MPVVYLSERDKLCSRMAKWIYGEMRLRRISQEKLAEKMGIRQQSLSRKLRTKSFDFNDFCFFVKEFKPSQSELLELVGLDE